MEEQKEQLFYIGTYAAREERGIYLHRCVLNLHVNYTAYGKKGSKKTMRK